MASTMAPSTPTGIHLWTADHKRLLCILSRFLKVAGSDDGASLLPQGSERILWHLFAKDTGRPGTTPILTAGGVRRMLYELYRRSNPAWRTVFCVTDFDEGLRHWATDCTTLQGAANVLGIRLVRRRTDHPIAAKQIEAITRSTISVSPRQLHSEPPPDDLDNSNISPNSLGQENSSQTVTSSRGLDSATSWNSYSYLDRIKGHIAFRVWTPMSHSINGKNGCLSGTWAGRNDIPPDRTSSAFIDSAYVHLRPIPEPSNFLSITTSFLVALRLLLWKQNATLAIIDMAKLYQNDDPASRLTPARAIINRMENFRGILQHSRDDGTEPSESPARNEYRYGSITEWLVWGEIPENAIKITVTGHEIITFLSSNPTVDHALHLQEIGQLDSTFQASRFLRGLRIKASRKVGRAVGALTAFLSLDVVDARKLAMGIKSSWGIENHANTRRAQRRYSPIYGTSPYMLGFFCEFADRLSAVQQSNPGSLDSMATEYELVDFVDLTLSDDDDDFSNEEDIDNIQEDDPVTERSENGGDERPGRILRHEPAITDGNGESQGLGHTFDGARDHGTFTVDIPACENTPFDTVAEESDDEMVYVRPDHDTLTQNRQRIERILTKSS